MTKGVQRGLNSSMRLMRLKKIYNRLCLAFIFTFNDVLTLTAPRIIEKGIKILPEFIQKKVCFFLKTVSMIVN